MIKEPDDIFNSEWNNNVAKSQYQNPKPKSIYDLVVIGAGTAGLVTSAAAATLGARVAMVEKKRLGGDCLNVGCVPSKSLLASAKKTWEKRKSGQEIDLKGNFKNVMEDLRKKRAVISHHDSITRLSNLGVEVFFGNAFFNHGNTVQVEGTELRYKKAVIATGARAAAPAIPGLDSTFYFTNENIFDLIELPLSLAIIGAGPIGVEMAQAFNRLGAKVHLIDIASQILTRENKEAADFVQRRLVQEGVHLHLSAKILAIKEMDSIKEIHLEGAEGPQSISCQHVMISAGRAANVEGLQLEMAGIHYGPKGVMVDERMRTSNGKVYACGDICFPHKFTHAADFTARIVVQNALFFGRKKSSALRIPWVTYSDPELAHIGPYARELKQMGMSYQTHKIYFNEVDRSILEDEQGFVEILTDNRGKIYGATMVHSLAGEMISQIALAMNFNIGLGKIASTIYPYPTRVEAIRKLGDRYNRSRITPFIAKAMKILARI